MSNKVVPSHTQKDNKNGIGNKCKGNKEKKKTNKKQILPRCQAKESMERDPIFHNCLRDLL